MKSPYNQPPPKKKANIVDVRLEGFADAFGSMFEVLGRPFGRHVEHV